MVQLSPPGQGPADPLTTGAGPDGILMRADRFNKGTVQMALPLERKILEHDKCNVAHTK